MEPEETKPCRYCRSTVSVKAVKCPFCGEILHAGLKRHVQAKYDERDDSKDAVAAVMTVFVPGLGHIYKGYVGNGVLWLLITWPLCGIGVGFILWIWLIFRAYKIDVA